MRIALIQPPGRGIFSITPEPPLGLAYLSAALLKNIKEIEIKIIDGCILDEKEYRNEVSKLKADIIGVTSTMSQLGDALKVPSISGDREAIFIIGGSGVRNLPSSKIYESGYSTIIFGEGEETIVELVKALGSRTPIESLNGISYMKDGKEFVTPPRKPIENLDVLPMPARHLLDMETYLKIWEEKMGIRTTQMVTSRGCPFSCRFCDKNVFGSKVRFMSNMKIIKEMKELKDMYSVEHIYFEEDLFTFNKKRVIELCDMIKKEVQLKSGWSAQARVDTIDFEMLSKMKDAGCTDLMFGVESGSQRILDFLGKGFTVEKIKESFKLVKKAGINGGIFLIIGVPGETQRDIDLTKKLINEIRPSVVNISFLTPIPGTEIYEATKHLIRNDVIFYNFNEQYESVYRQEVFESSPKERLHEMMDYFLENFKGKIDPRYSVGDGTALL